MAIQFQSTSPANLAFERKIHKHKPANVHFEGLKQDTVSFGMAAPSAEAAKGVLSKAVGFVKKYAGKILEYGKKALQLLMSIPKKLMGLFAKKAPEAAQAAEQVVKAAT